MVRLVVSLSENSQPLLTENLVFNLVDIYKIFISKQLFHQCRLLTSVVITLVYLFEHFVKGIA